jgi:hypothetical protein
MSDLQSVEGWKPRFEAWTEKAVPLFKENKAKQAFGKYPWFTTEGDPFTRLAKPVRESRVGLVATGGYSIEGEQEPFKPFPDLGAAAPQLREIPLDIDPARLRIDHFGYDHRFAEQDTNVNLPLARLKELVAQGEIGSLSPNTQVLMGLIPNVGPLLGETIPRIVSRFQADGVDAVLLVPS